MRDRKPTETVVSDYIHWLEITVEDFKDIADRDKRINGIISCIKQDIEEEMLNQMQRKALLAFFKGLCKRKGLQFEKYKGL